MPRRKVVKVPPFLRRPRRRKVGVWLVLGAFFIKALVPFGLTGSAASGFGAATSPASAFSYSIVLCTPNGIKVIRVDDQGMSLPDRASDDGSCVLCLPQSKDHACEPGLQEYLLQARLPTGRQPNPEDSEVSEPAVWFDATFPRAPPVSA